MDTSAEAPLDVVVLGGGVAGLEAALALRALAGERTAVTVVSPESEFTYRPQRVGEPFAGAEAQRIPLERFAAAAGFSSVQDRVTAVDVDARTVSTAGGTQLGYGALLVAPGGLARPYFEHATTIDDRRLDEQLHGLVQDLEAGYIGSLAFVVPSPMAWPLPIYELALMAARRAWEMNVNVEIELITPEEKPLAALGPAASAALSRLLAENRVVVRSSAATEIPEPGLIQLDDGQRIRAERIVALPRLLSPAIPGIPARGADGFIEVDAHCRVDGVERVWAAGDAIAFPIKHGGLAAQQADAAAEAIAALAGAAIEPRPFRPVVRAMLIGAGRPLYIQTSIDGDGEISREPLWSPEGKIAAHYLGDFLAGRDLQGVAP